MRNKLIIGFLALTATLTPQLASAQGPPGRGPGGPFGGGPPPMQQPGVMLLQIQEVRDELALRDEQKKPLDDLLEKLQRESMEGFDFRQMFTLGEEERQQKFAELQKRGEALTAKAMDEVATILDAKQTVRFEQLQLQKDGLAAFLKPAIADELQLSPQQRDEIEQLVEDNRPRFGGGPPDFRKLEEQNRKSLDTAIDLLSDDQLGSWILLTGKAFNFPQPSFGRGGRGFGPGGPMGGKKRKLVKQFDKDKDGWLNNTERQAARASLKDKAAGGGRGRRGGRFGRGSREPAKPGPKVSPEEVESYADQPLYEPSILRTIFLEFENEDWEDELQEFKNTNVEVPATLTVDGKEYPQVGVHFRGMSSYMMVPAGHKRSLNLSLDFVHQDQRLYGYKTLNLLNCNGDASMMSTALYSQIAREHIPAPKANFVKVVINGESWGIYANVQQFNKEFLTDNYGTENGARWKVRGNPGGDAGLRYTGKELGEYKSRFTMKSQGGEPEWNALIELCRTLNETPLDQLEETLRPMLDIDEALWFLAIDVALVNSDGYWTRASDYSLFRDEAGVFHVIPHDMNEAFHGSGGHLGRRRPRGEQRRRPERGRPEGDRPARREGPPRGPGGGRGGPGGGGGFELDPLVNIDNPRFPLRSQLLAVPKLRAQYLDNIRQIAETSLDWQYLGPIIAQYRKLIEKEVEADTRKLDSLEAFQHATAAETESGAETGRQNSLRDFAMKRRKFLLEYREPKDQRSADKTASQ